MFLTAGDMAGTYPATAFQEHLVAMAPPMSADDLAQYWQTFINGHIPNFNKTPFEQIDTYVKDCWDAIVETAVWAQKDLPRVLDEVKPDIVCVDNVILFPAIKQYGKPWVRIISCSENEIPDPDIPPHLSGCAADDQACFAAFNAASTRSSGRSTTLQRVPPGATASGLTRSASSSRPRPISTSCSIPRPCASSAATPLDPYRLPLSRRLGAARKALRVPTFEANEDKPLIYVSFGSLGSGDTATLKRLVEALGEMPVRALVNVGGYVDSYGAPPPNVILDSWFPQPSVIPQVDAVIHHGGNNTFTECLYFGKPAIIMPYVWDGHDNAQRVDETGHGIKMHRADWTQEQLAASIQRLLTDKAMAERLKKASRAMQAAHGPSTAANRLDDAPQARPPRDRPLLLPRRISTTRRPVPSDLADWGLQPDMLEGHSHSSGPARVQRPGQSPGGRLLALHAGPVATHACRPTSSATSSPGARPTAAMAARRSRSSRTASFTSRTDWPAKRRSSSRSPSPTC